MTHAARADAHRDYLERLLEDVDAHRSRAAFYRGLAESLLEDVARLSTELVRLRGIVDVREVTSAAKAIARKLPATKPRTPPQRVGS
jgi:hypothetical protein